MTQAPLASTPMPEDSLVASYHAAVAELEKNDSTHAAGPSPQVRANIQAYAEQQAQARAETSDAPHSVAARADIHSAASTSTTEKPAANDSQWKIRALASIAIFGLSGLLFMQWERAPQDEKDVAFSTARPAPAAVGNADKAQAASPAPASAIATAPAPVVATTPASPAAADKADQALPAAPAAAQARSKEADVQAQATAGAPNSAKKIKRESTRSDSETSATSAQPSIADSAKDKAMEQPAPASGPAPAPAPAPAPTPAPAPLSAPAAAARARSSTDEASSAPSITQSTPQGGLQRQAAPALPNTALFTAIRNKDAAALQQALNEGADKNAKRNGTPAITLCVQAGLADMVQLLVNAGADVNAVDAQGIAPLAHARERGLAQIVSILLKAGAKSDTNQPLAQ